MLFSKVRWTYLLNLLFVMLLMGRAGAYLAFVICYYGDVARGYLASYNKMVIWLAEKVFWVGFEPYIVQDGGQENLGRSIYACALRNTNNTIHQSLQI